MRSRSTSFSFSPGSVPIHERDEEHPGQMRVRVESLGHGRIPEVGGLEPTAGDSESAGDRDEGVEVPRQVGGQIAGIGRSAVDEA